MAEPIISDAALAAIVRSENLAVIDCRFNLGATDAGRAAYLEGHIPGAVYAHLDHDLSGPPTTDCGRHPLPPVARLEQVFARWGIDPTTRVVAYDDASGMVAARLWWMLRYLGHTRVQVLDGGWQCWVAAGRAVASGNTTRRPRRYAGTVDRRRLVTRASVGGCSELLDAREPPRYRGEIEPIDPRAGHIPGARNHYWQDNIGPDGRFLGAAELRARLRDALTTLPGADTVHYCGSGVSACHNVLAQVIAGLAEPRLYCGSWSEWCRTEEGRVS